MKPLSIEIRRLIESLEWQNAAPGGLPDHEPERTELLRLIAAAGEPAAIYPLLVFSLRGGTIAEDSASAIRQILSTAPALEWVRLDHWARRIAPYWNDHWLGWDNLSPTELPQLARLGDGWAVLAMATMHRSGHVREAALRQLSAVPTRRTLPFYLLRMNDWVEPVRRVAAAAMLEFARAPELDALVAALPLLLQMPTWRRGELQPFVAQLLSHLERPDARPALARGLESPDRYVRRECFRLTLAAPGLEPAEVAAAIEQGLMDPDVRLRLEAARHLPLLPDETLWRLAAVAHSDPFMPVRREALAAMVGRFAAEATPFLQAALLDPHTSIRDLGRCHLQQQPGDFDPADFYRAALERKEGRARRAAILGLSESGSTEDVPRLLPLCAHPRVEIREAAVRALGRLDAENAIDAILRALADPSPRVSKQARRVLEVQRALPIQDWVWEVVCGAELPPHAPLNALHALSRLTRWAALPFLLRAACLANPPVAAAAQVHLDEWLARCHRSFQRPTSEQAREAQAALAAAAPILTPARYQSLRDELAHWDRTGF